MIFIHTEENAQKQEKGAAMNDDNPAYQLARRAQKRAILKRRRKPISDADPKHCTGVSPHTSRLSPTQQAGQLAEDQAARWLQQAGLQVIARNLRCKVGEIDLVAIHAGTLVFIEVRQRRSQRYGGAAASVNRAKQQRLLRAAQFFLPRLIQAYFGGRHPACRFDVISIEPTGLVWIKQAFNGS